MQLTIAANIGPLVAIRAQLEARIAEAVQRTAEEIRDKAKAAAPVLTGRLRSEIATEAGESPLEAFVVSPTPYAPYQEFGTRKMAAQPFLIPAAEEERGAFLDRVRAAIEG